jgi:hypothetical protein
VANAPELLARVSAGPRCGAAARAKQKTSVSESTGNISSGFFMNSCLELHATLNKSDGCRKVKGMSMLPSQRRPMPLGSGHLFPQADTRRTEIPRL